MTHRMIAWRGGVVGLLAVCAFARLSISGDFRVFHFILLRFHPATAVLEEGGRQDEVPADCCAGNPPG